MGSTMLDSLQDSGLGTLGLLMVFSQKVTQSGYRKLPEFEYHTYLPTN